MYAISVRDLCFGYDDILFDNVCFSINKGSFVTILGRSGTGKSTLFRILSGDIVCDNVFIYGKSLNYALEKGYIGIVSLSYYFTGTVIDKFLNIFRCKGVESHNYNDRIRRVVRKLKIEDILNCSFGDLSNKNRVLVMFAIQLLAKPKIVLIDNAFSCLDDEIEQIVKEIKRLNKRSTIVNITNDTEECMFGNEIAIVDKKIKMISKNSITYDDFIDNGLTPPFIISLCAKLELYGVINDYYYDIERLVDDLWQ